MTDEHVFECDHDLSAWMDEQQTIGRDDYERAVRAISMLVRPRSWAEEVVDTVLQAIGVEVL